MVRGIIPRQPAKSGRQEGRGAIARGAQSRGASRQPQKGGARHAAVPFLAPPAKSAAKPVAAPKSYQPTSPERIKEILRRLDQTYPGATCALHHSNAWELLVATILSAQCTDVRVNMTTPELFRKYPTPQAFAALKPEQLEPDIRSTGFFRNKSKSVVGAAKKLIEEFGGQVPDDMDKLLSLPGVARKTANVVLGTWFGKAEGVVVDTHVYRISRRLELTSNTDVQKVEQDLMRVLPRDKWIIFSHQIIWHGRKLCIARRPKCAECPLENLCHAADKTWSTVEIHKSAKP
ncbi:MAG TPA: endonuclease III [Terriglobales bacterium]|nr:endonuclease III [Terriglobales bacterium]